MNKRLTKSRDSVIDGVCGGIANYMGIDPVIVRLIFAFGAFAYGAFFLTYLILMFVMPDEI